MLTALHRKMVAITNPAAIVDNAAVTTATINTAGYRYLVINLLLGATDIAVASLKVQESDDSGMSGAADITGTIMGTSANDTGSTSTVPSATDDNKFFQWCIDLRGRKQYIDLVLTGGDGTSGAFFCAWAELWRAEQTPLTATQAGISQRFLV